jgi:hypothetical protein
MLVDEILKLIQKIQRTDDAIARQRRDWARFEEQVKRTEVQQMKRRKILATLQRLLAKEQSRAQQPRT